MRAHPENLAADAPALNKTQQLAVLLVMLGPESAAQLLKPFQPQEVEAISREMARANLATREQKENILREFSQVALAANASFPSDTDAVRHSPETPAADPPAPAPAQHPPLNGMQGIATMDAHHIFSLIREELPQTIAFVISHLSADKAAQVSALFRPELRDRIIERLATLGPTPAEAADKVVDVLNSRLGFKQPRGRLTVYEMA